MMMKSMPEGALGELAGKTGVNKNIIGKVLEKAAPQLLEGVAKNFKKDDSFIEKALNLGEDKKDNIISMILGSKAESILNPIAQKFGISPEITKIIISKALPFVLDQFKSGKITPDMMSAAAGLADGVDMKDVKNIAGAFLNKKGGKGILDSLGGFFGKK